MTSIFQNKFLQNVDAGTNSGTGGGGSGEIPELDDGTANIYVNSARVRQLSGGIVLATANGTLTSVNTISQNEVLNLTEDQELQNSRLDAIEEEIGQPFPTSRIDNLEQKTTNVEYDNVLDRTSIDGDFVVIESTFTTSQQTQDQRLDTLENKTTGVTFNGTATLIDGQGVVSQVELNNSQEVQDLRLDSLEQKTSQITVTGTTTKVNDVLLVGDTFTINPNTATIAGDELIFNSSLIEFSSVPFVQGTASVADDSNLTTKRYVDDEIIEAINSLPPVPSLNELQIKTQNQSATLEQTSFVGNVNVTGSNLYLQGTATQNAGLITFDADKRGALFRNTNNTQRTTISYPVNDINNNRVSLDFSTGVANTGAGNGGIIIKLGATTGNTGYTVFYNVFSNTLNYTDANGSTVSTGITNQSSIVVEYNGSRLRLLDPSNTNNELFGVNISKAITSSNIDIIGNGSTGNDLKFENLTIQEYEDPNNDNSSVTVGKIQNDSNTTSQELVTKEYVQSQIGGTSTFVKMFDPITAQTTPLYEDQNIRFEWDETAGQPTFTMKANGQADIGAINPYISFNSQYLNSGAVIGQQNINVNGFEFSFTSSNPAVERPLYFTGTANPSANFSLSGSSGAIIKAGIGLDDILTADYYLVSLLGGYINSPDAAKCTFRLEVLRSN